MKTPAEIIALMTPEQKKAARDDIGDALDIVAEIVGPMSYSSVFTLTCAVMESLEP